MFHKTILIIIISAMFQSCNINDLNEGQNETKPSSFDSSTHFSSKKLQIKRKRNNQLIRSISKILGMNKNQLCLELGKIPCADIVHKVSLGGMDAYGNSQYELEKKPSVTAPMALDRLVLAACSTRASLDIINPSQGVIFRNINITDDGRIEKDQNFYESIDRLYQRAFLRRPEPAEVKAMENLYIDIYNENPLGVARNWAVLSCYVVLSSIEFIFY